MSLVWLSSAYKCSHCLIKMFFKLFLHRTNWRWEFTFHSNIFQCQDEATFSLPSRYHDTQDNIVLGSVSPYVHWRGPSTLCPGRTGCWAQLSRADRTAFRNLPPFQTLLGRLGVRLSWLDGDVSAVRWKINYLQPLLWLQRAGKPFKSWVWLGKSWLGFF